MRGSTSLRGDMFYMSLNACCQDKMSRYIAHFLRASLSDGGGSMSLRGDMSFNICCQN